MRVSKITAMVLLSAFTCTAFAAVSLTEEEGRYVQKNIFDLKDNEWDTWIAAKNKISPTGKKEEELKAEVNKQLQSFVAQNETYKANIAATKEKIKAYSDAKGLFDKIQEDKTDLKTEANKLSPKLQIYNQVAQAIVDGNFNAPMIPVMPGWPAAPGGKGYTVDQATKYHIAQLQASFRIKLDEGQKEVIKNFFTDLALNAFSRSQDDLDKKTKELLEKLKSEETLKTEAEAKVSEIAEKESRSQKTKEKVQEAILDNEISSLLSPGLSELNLQNALSLASKLPTNASSLNEASKQALSGNTLSKALVNELNSAQNADKKEQIKQALKNSVDLRLEIMRENLSQKETRLANLLKNSLNSENKFITELLANSEKDELLSAIKELDKSVSKSAKSKNSQQGAQAISLITQLQGHSRLATLTSPDLRLAKAIKALSKSTLAGAESGAIKSYLSEYEYKGGVWASAYGAKASVKNAPNPKIAGLSVGYDAGYDTALIGIYASFANSHVSDETMNNNGKLYQFGTYARVFMDSAELDLKAAAGFGSNRLKTSLNLANQHLNQTGKYSSQLLAFEALYGYVFNPFGEYFIKPLIGLEYSHTKSGKLDLKGAINTSFDATHSNSLSVKIGAELRAYYLENSYFYALPALGYELYKSAQNSGVRLGSSNESISYDSGIKKRASFELKMGANTEIARNLSLDLSAGTKLNADLKLFSLNAGLKYKF